LIDPVALNRSADRLTYARRHALRREAAEEEATRRLTTVTRIEKGHTCKRHGIAAAEGGTRR
jgi:hypothetical protein